MILTGWSEEKSLDITNGAIFLMDPEEKIVDGDEYLLAQITVRENTNPTVILNVQGKTTLLMDSTSERSWTERNIRYDLISLSNGRYAYTQWLYYLV